MRAVVFDMDGVLFDSMYEGMDCCGRNERKVRHGRDFP